MRNEKHYPLPLERRERFAELRSVQPHAKGQDGHDGPRDPIHVGQRKQRRPATVQMQMQLVVAWPWWSEAE